MSLASESVGHDEVRTFYAAAPADHRCTIDAAVDAIRAQDAVAAFPVLPRLLTPEARVLDVGCGDGFFGNSIALNYGAQVTGIDFEPSALKRARQVAAALEVEVDYVQTDLFDHVVDAPFDVVVSLGVLHHTGDCHAGIRRLCRDFVRPGGHVLIGLYHSHGRQPFQDHFRRLQADGASEAQLLERFRQLQSQPVDEATLRFRFREQVMHPHETHHTLAEIAPVLEAAGVKLAATSINWFEPFFSVKDLYDLEPTYRRIAEQRLAANRYFPGFFAVLGRRRTDG